MVDKEFVYENILRFQMTEKGLPSLKKALIKELKQKKPVSFRKYSIEQTIDSIKDIQKKKDFDYYDAIVFLVCFSSDFFLIEKEVKNGSFDLNIDFKREDYWRNEDVGFKEALFFIYPFFLQTYSTEANIDLKKIYEKVNLVNNNPQLALKMYLDFEKKVKKKSGRI